MRPPQRPENDRRHSWLPPSPAFREKPVEKSLALRLRNVWVGVIRERDGPPNEHTGGELLDDGEPSHSGRRLRFRAWEACVILNFDRSRRPKPVISMLVAVEK